MLNLFLQRLDGSLLPIAIGALGEADLGAPPLRDVSERILHFTTDKKRRMSFGFIGED